MRIETPRFLQNVYSKLKKAMHVIVTTDGTKENIIISKCCQLNIYDFCRF